MSWNEVIRAEWFASVVSTLLLVLVILFGRRLAVRALLKREKDPPEVLRRWVIDTRNIAIALIVFGVILIWGPQLRAFALSLAAFAVAVVVAGKELILCVVGSMYRAGSRAFAIGERIEVGGVRGDIIDKSMLTTTLLEVGPGHSNHDYTGRAVVVPNALLLAGPTYSETFTEAFGFHLFTIPLGPSDDWNRAEQALLVAANEECAAFLTTARTHLDALRRRHGLPAISVEPQVTVDVPEPGRINLIVRVPVPVRKTGTVEQAILRRYLSTQHRSTLA